MRIKSKNAEKIFMNYMKFFGIVYLLIWHTGIRYLNVFTISFFLQMFFFISGYFYKDNYSAKPMSFIKRRAIALYIPFIWYCSILLLLNNIFVEVNIYKKNMYLDSTSMTNKFLSILAFQPSTQMAGAMWFVSSLFSVSVMYCIINYILEFKKNVSKKNFNISLFCVVMTLFVVANYLSYLKIRLPMYIDISFVALIFYYLGHMYNKNEKHIPMNFFIALSAILTISICIKYGYPQLLQRKYVNPPLLLVCGIFGIYINLYISQKLASIKKINIFNYIGENTLSILALHFLAFKAVSILIISAQNLPIEILSSFPVIKESNQYYRWLYLLSGLTIPIILKYLFDISYSKSVSFYTKE
ncbi:MAG: acyltransferase family protein [Parcubacteria group bacterium]|nr:acyltransferase family protein [Parcubacteria group bacterium]